MNQSISQHDDDDGDDDEVIREVISVNVRVVIFY